MGDPLGIGPEIIVKALRDPVLRRRARWLVYGAAEAVCQAADLAEIEPYWMRVQHDSVAAETAIGAGMVVMDYDELGAAVSPGSVPTCATRAGGEASFRFVEDAIRDAKREVGDALHLDGVVTGPICKRAWAMAGRGKYPGHTELFATRLGARRCAMMFVAPELRVTLVTTHVPINELRNILTIGRIFDPIDLTHEACVEMGVARPRIAVCGLNPHAGEGGLFGDEEERLIEPAIRMAVTAGMDVLGPFAADTVFGRAVRGEFDAVVAMYHDQGLIPVKLLAWDRAVNVTIGLSTVRTSPDHGTAFDIAGKNRADVGSMRAALELAVDMVRARRRAAAAV
jgi:4-hydroxythreonine-4-phosphate dehydrogenase